MPAALVTGGSGFVGGRLVERLAERGWDVRALARSDAAAEAVRARGATPVRGDLADEASLSAAARGAEYCFHAAAQVAEWGRWRDFVAANVTGTRNVVRACRAAGVRRLVHVGTESALMHGQPLVFADERLPLAERSPAPYARTKARAEAVVLTESGPDLEAVVVRPRFVWGRGDTTLLPAILAAAQAGRWAWIGGGRHLTSTTHVENTVHGLLLAAERGRSGGVWFVTDGAPVVFRDFVEALAATQGVRLPQRSIPVPIARAVRAAGEAAWRALPLPGAPPLTRTALWLSSLECTLSDRKARSELGYAPLVGREQGLQELSN